MERFARLWYQRMRVAKYMAEMGLDARYKKSFKVQTTDSKHSLAIAERLFRVEDEQSMPTKPAQVLAVISLISGSALNSYT